MICLAAAIGVLGIAAMGRAHRCGRGFHGYGWYGPYGDGLHGHGARRHWMMRALFRRIDATPAQERAIVAELEKLEDRVHAAKAGVHDARGDLAAAVRGPVLDDAALGAVLGRVDAAVGEVRSAVIDALRAVHGLLDDRQRGQIADLLERRGWGRRGPAGPAPVQV
jgi:Spy/CpxP family protein refolding chaperone